MKNSIFIIKTGLCIAAFFLIASDLFAQKIWEERKGMTRGQGNVAAGYFLSRREFKLTAGLGWNFRLIKNKVNTPKS
jgi:hypothetical protein